MSVKIDRLCPRCTIAKKQITNRKPERQITQSIGQPLSTFNQKHEAQDFVTAKRLIVLILNPFLHTIFPTPQPACSMMQIFKHYQYSSVLPDTTKYPLMRQVLFRKDIPESREYPIFLVFNFKFPDDLSFFDQHRVPPPGRLHQTLHDNRQWRHDLHGKYPGLEQGQQFQPAGNQRFYRRLHYDGYQPQGRQFPLGNNPGLGPRIPPPPCYVCPSAALSFTPNSSGAAAITMAVRTSAPL